MGIFLDKIVKPLLRSKRANWIHRVNTLIQGQLDVANSGTIDTEIVNDKLAFAIALDGMVDLIDNYDILLKSVSKRFAKFDIKTAKPIHKIALKSPEKLSEKEQLRFFDEFGVLVMRNIELRHEDIPVHLLRLDSFGLLSGALGMICFPETREKGFQLWEYLHGCFLLCEKFKYKKHLPKELVKLLEIGVFDK